VPIAAAQRKITKTRRAPKARFASQLYSCDPNSKNPTTTAKTTHGFSVGEGQNNSGEESRGKEQKTKK